MFWGCFDILDFFGWVGVVCLLTLCRFGLVRCVSMGFMVVRCLLGGVVVEYLVVTLAV